MNKKGLQMKHRVLISLLLLALLLLGGPAISPVVAGNPGVALAEETPVFQTFTYEDGNPPDALLESIASAPYTHLAVQGTLWTPERRARFQVFSPKGWGTFTGLKAVNVPGDEWVHIPLPLITYLEDVGQKIDYVEFCARSTNGAVTKPVQIHLWAHDVRFYAGAITWPANNNLNCHGVMINPPVWKQALGISVLLHFQNSADRITLYKAWVKTER